MIKAYHIIGFHRPEDQFHLSQLDHREVILADLQKRHQMIIQSGALLPAGKNHLNESRMFALDHLAGDDQYVFLSLGKRYWLSPDEANFGFVFNAETLFLKCGAILRDGDLMSDYEDLLDSVVSEYTRRTSPEQWTKEETAKLFEMLDDPDASDVDYVSPNDGYYALCDAVEKQDMSVPYAREATEKFIRRAKLLQGQRQLHGQTALTAGKDDALSGRYEVLVPEKLAVSGAVAYIQYGQEVESWQSTTLPMPAVM